MSKRSRNVTHMMLACGWRAIALRTALLAVGWWCLNEGELGGAALGTLVVASSLAVSVALSTLRPPSWRLGGVVELVFVFLIGSIRGGFDVARRALGRGQQLSPAIRSHASRLRGRSSTHLFSSALSMMPGTLSVVVRDRQLDVHVLVDEPRSMRALDRLEDSIARAVGETLEAPHA